ncbi:patatin-like phospholipase family protein [Streptomyces tubbatahanensis]|uniref:Patatin-like phospholipase family protein n=1 Tax=Streptomyces tubbatahanensis TaxID=2923272 RepID=A0ABY3XUZ9_9ACTN|nr:patatin-like phospholipase family protein [Streptomyces tubbatahanensis]UNS98136.1 patatin-like phospholipase family protein [Streptomyces tubbatahanensis]
MDGTALVLGGGGPVGGAWMVGVLAGLTEAGVELDRADVVIGTSAGAIFGARVLGGESPRALYERQLAGEERIDLEVSAAQTFRFLWAACATRDSRRSAQRLGRAALAAPVGHEGGALDAVRPLLGGERPWPERALRIAAVDAQSGEVETFGSDSSLSLLEAVAASCAVPLVWPPVSAAGRRWLDGGCRSAGNVRLARGYRRVVAVVPIPSAPGPHPSARQEADELVAEGASVVCLTPDAASRRAMGRDMTADSRRPDTARAGHAQAVAAARTVADVLHG